MRPPRALRTGVPIAALVALLLGAPGGRAWAQQPAAGAGAHDPPAAAGPGCPAGVPARLCEPWPRGEIVDPVACRSDPSKSFALYLPPAYTPARRWPLLVLLDARGRGRLAAERFQAAAERFGWAIVSSNDSASDADWEAIRAPAAAVLADAAERLAIDPRRIVLGGFSGTARGAGAIAANAGGGIAGVFVAGAGLPAALEVEGLPFAVFAAAGSEDFNFQEVDALAEPLAAAGVAHRVEVFDGGHAWPPAELAGEALAWFELRAMAAGSRPFDTGLAAELAAGWVADAAAREEGGDPVGAQRLHRSTAADLTALLERGEAAAARDLARLRALRDEASAAVERLGAASALRRALAERRRDAAWESDRRRELEELLAPLRRLDDQPPLDTPTRGRRLVEKLQAEAAGGGSRALAARRVLALAAANAGFYFPRDLLAAGEYRRAEIVLELAVLVREGDPVAWYNLACARARLGRETEALDALERAVAAGWRDPDHIAADPDLESLRGNERFAALVARAREPAD